MELPSPPTDSFYKFFSIASLAGCVFFLTLGAKAVDELASQTYDLVLQVRKAEIELSYLGKDLKYQQETWKQTKKNTERLEAELSALNPKTKNAVAIVREALNQIYSGLSESTESLSKLTERLKQQELKKAEVEVTRERLADNQRRTGQLINWLIFLLICLGLQSIWGFSMWYLRIQVPQDKILRNQAAATNAKKDGSA